MIPATPGPKIPENGPELEFQLEFLQNFEPRAHLQSHLAIQAHVPLYQLFCS
jgi:hypothetical protein